MLKRIISHVANKIKPNNSSYDDLQLQLIYNASFINSNNSIKLVVPNHIFNSETLPISSLLNLKTDNIIEQILEIPKKQIAFQINQAEFIKDVLQEPQVCCANSKNIIVEYSSPNIAKPFHVGNLRSTIIGNFLSNINKYLNNSVVRLNYLGDWGTQFGYLNAGLDILNIPEEKIEKDPIRILYDAYVIAHSMSEDDPRVTETARMIFNQLEQGDEIYLDRWQILKKYAVVELEKTYYRLGVKFDSYHWESMYNVRDIQNVIRRMKSFDILRTDDKKRQIVHFEDRDIPILKSDNTSLYITRDIAAAIDRFEKFRFNQMLYIVDNAQTDHFKSLQFILSKMGFDWANDIFHVKFGRVRGMSTRKGTAVFLSDILDEAQDLMLKKQIQSPTTKVPVTDKSISDTLGISCVIINDLKQRRQKDYDFDWDRILQVQGDSGTKLQYTHCRLVNLEENCGVSLPRECYPELLSTSPEALELIAHLARFYTTIHKAASEMEACILVSYLFQLCNLTSRCLKQLRVKDQEKETSQQRLLLFHSVRKILFDGMIILGLKPLSKM